MMRVSNFLKLPRDQALNTLVDRIIENFITLRKTIQFCESNNYHGYRISSDLIPVINHPDLDLSFEKLPRQGDMMKAINECKDVVQKSKLRFSAHPSEFISLTSDNEKVITNSIRDLIAHAFVFDLLGLPNDYRAPLNIHVRKDGCPEFISKTVIKNIDRCPSNVKNRLVFENNDNKNGTWSIKRLITYFHTRIGIPITFDNLHHEMLSDNLTEQQAFEAAYCTWPVEPIFHYSEGINGTRKHADYATRLPKSYKPVVWEVELKQKDLAIQKMYAMNN